MPVPDNQSVMLPLLSYAASKDNEISTSDSVDALAKQLHLSERDLKEMLPSGTQQTFDNRVGWAATYMKKAGLLEPTRRGFYKITARGKELLAKKPTKIDVKLLKQFKEFQDFQQLKGTRSKDKTEGASAVLEYEAATPSEALEKAYESPPLPPGASPEILPMNDMKNSFTHKEGDLVNTSFSKYKVKEIRLEIQDHPLYRTRKSRDST